ncbi:MAG TPA: hypothetical protein VGG74_03745 [Kofleriaceae bacterium]|jgi:hypothetical protein
MQIVTRLVLVCSLALAACSHNNNGDDDNGDAGSGGSNSALNCDYTEMSDAGNSTTAEATGQTLATRTVLCGNVDTGHYGSGSTVVDVDSYTIAVTGSPAELLVDFQNDTPASLTDFQVSIFDTGTPPTLLNAGDYTGQLGDHGAFLSELAAGNYTVVVTATAAAATSAAIPYKVVLYADQPTTRCPDLTGSAADYTEANDGAANKGNDVIGVDFSKSPSFTSIAGTAEATALTIDPGKSSHIAGSSASVAAGSDKYLDRDTYEITTGAAMNELSVRLNWPGTTADLDYIVVPESSLSAANEAATLSATQEDEFATFAVQPNTKYWLWVGAYDGSTGAPIAYSASVCGGQFPPAN